MDLRFLVDTMHGVRALSISRMRPDALAGSFDQAW